MKINNFEDLKLSANILKAVKELGFEEPTPIQAEAIPVVLAGKDMIGQAQTGTGKTAAFALPLIEKIDLANKNTQAIVLCPTRELAVQVAEEINKFSINVRGITYLPVYGGSSMERQLKALRRGVQIVIGTPGRVLDHLERRTLRLEHVKIAVLDEADEMLNMGFREDIETILDHTPAERQTVMFSATMAKPILELAKKYLSDPEVIKMKDQQLTVPLIDQYYYEIRGNMKIDAVGNLMDYYNVKRALLFTNTKRNVDELVGHLRSRGYEAEGLHGDMKQGGRDKVMSRFKKGTIEILVATDVAARGIDVDDIEAVFNYDLPQDTEYYVHRIGRTGRAGKSGMAFTFITGGKEFHRLRYIEKVTNTKIKFKKLPTSTELLESKFAKISSEIRNVIENGKLEKYSEIVERLTDNEFTVSDLSAALLKMYMGDTDENKGTAIELSSSRFEREYGDDRGGRSRDDRGRGRDRDDDRGSRRRFDSDEGNDDRPRLKLHKSDFKLPRRNDDDSSDEGGEYRQEAPRRSRGRTVHSSALTKLHLSIGKKDRLKPGDIVGAITGETNVKGDTIGQIELHDNFSFVEVPSESVQEIMDKMNNISRIRGKKLKIDISRPLKNKE